MSFLTENVNVTLIRTNYANGNEITVFSTDATMYPGGPGENLVMAYGPDPDIQTFYHIVIMAPQKVKGMVLLVAGDILRVVALSDSAFGYDDDWRVQADPMAYNGGKSFNSLNSQDIIVKRVKP